MHFYNLHRLVETVRTSFWFTPLMMALGAIALAYFFRSLDALLPASSMRILEVLGQLGPDGTRLVLSTIAGSMITVAGVIFSITIVALNMTSAQFGPGLLQKFMKSGETQSAMGTFIASFIFSLLTLLQISGNAPELPVASVFAAVVLGILSFFVMIYFIHHTARLLQASRIVDSVAEEAVASFDRLFDERKAAAPGPTGEEQRPEFSEGEVLTAPFHGYIQTVDFDGLVSLASRQDAVINFDVRVGQHLITGQPIGRRIGGDESDITSGLERYITVGRERTVSQDPEFAVEQLAEIAVRSLSPGINDPYTAINCIDQLGRVLSKLAGKAVPDTYMADKDGKPRLFLVERNFASIVDSAFDSIRQNALGQPSVQIRLIEVIGKLAWLDAEHDLTDALAAQLEKMAAAFESDFRIDADRATFQARHQDAVRRLVGAI